MFLSNRFDDDICNITLYMINMLESLPSENPYETTAPPNEAASAEPNADKRTLVICASEIIKVLEILSPQTLHSMNSSDPVLRSIADAWELEQAWPKTKFDMLKQQLLQLMEPGFTAKDVHPCLESWAEFTVDKFGRPEPSSAHQEMFDPIGRGWDRALNIVQKAAFRLCSDASTDLTEPDAISTTRWTRRSTIRELFEEEISKSQAETRMVDKVYWKKALETLDKLYCRPSFVERKADDTEILSQPFKLLVTAGETSMSECHSLDNHIGSYENAYKVLKRQVKSLMSGLEELRLKLWYTSQVVHSAIYLDARNVASALSHMAMPVLQSTARLSGNYRDQLRPSTSRSSRSSIFGEPQSDTMKLLKAPTEHGGPRKLADEQIENIKNWLKQYSIDNFCIGEERLHRFCMEVQLITKKLTGETMSQSPDLWSSELFTRERISYDVHTVGINSAPASTRPSSIYSESPSYAMSRPILRSLDSDARSVASDERSSIRRGSVYSLFQRGGFNTQLLTPELANSISSYGGRASSATTSNSDIFSQPVQSVTSASVYSRTSSILYGSLPDFGSRPPPALREKKKFREQLRKGLVCLLLSDLGSMVWSWGCETDAWIEDIQKTTSIQTQFRHRLATDALVHPEKSLSAITWRRYSADGTIPQLSLLATDETLSATTPDDTHLTALRDILSRMGKQVDPAAKLQACVDFYTVALEQMQLKSNLVSPVPSSAPQRRQSLQALESFDYRKDTTQENEMDNTTDSEPTELQIVDHLKRQLAELKPTRIFRDLQFTAVFAPPEMLDKKAAGKAFMHLGMAALEYKSELCSSMVDVADKIMASDVIKQQTNLQARSSLNTAAHYWRIAALERNRVAQRELAMLYLVHPEILPIATLPLAISSEIFQDEMMWQRRTKSTESKQALCLALHWMQQAANSGDEVAKGKLAERREFREQEQGLSIR